MAAAPTDERHEPWIPAWDGAAYAANTGHHRVLDEWFLRAFPSRPGDTILDLGCGSGDFTRTVAARVPDGHVVGVDAQPSMIDEARRVAAPNQSFIVAPAQDLATVFPSPEHDGRFDAVFSRAVLHWVPRADWPGILRQAHRLLKSGGWLRIECGGAGNVPQAVEVLDAVSARYDGPSAPWTFLDAGAALHLLEDAGFSVGADGYVHTVAQRRSFDRDGITGWVRSQAVEAYASGIDPDRRAAFLADVEASVGGFHRPDGTDDLTYVRLDLLVRRL